MRSGSARQQARADGRVLASPVARQMAREHGIDLASVRGSGPDGRIERKDVQALIDAASWPPLCRDCQRLPLAQDDATASLTSLRRATAR